MHKCLSVINSTIVEYVMFKAISAGNFNSNNIDSVVDQVFKNEPVLNTCY